MNTVNRKEYWDKKILKWEKDKYSRQEGLSRIFLDVNRSLKKRLEIAEHILMQISRGRTVLEIGCGTARLLPVIVQAKAVKYIGIDISTAAISQALARAQKMGVSDIAEFYQIDIEKLEDTDIDICFSLGLLDWLDLTMVQRMLQKIHCQYFFHSFSERRISIQQIIHKLYVFCMYGYRTKSYVPQYYTQEQMIDIFTSCYHFPVQCIRSKHLSFGAFISSLPEGVTFSK